MRPGAFCDGNLRPIRTRIALMPSELTDRINSVESANGRRKGTAPAVRRLKAKFPEMSERAIASKVGCSPSNVHHILRRYHSATSEASVRDFQENKALIVDQLAHRVASSITDAKLKKMSASQAFVGLGILIDKSQLLNGLATTINVSVLLDVAQAMRDRPAQVIDSHTISMASATTETE